MVPPIKQNSVHTLQAFAAALVGLRTRKPGIPNECCIGMSNAQEAVDRHPGGPGAWSCVPMLERNRFGKLCTKDVMCLKTSHRCCNELVTYKVHWFSGSCGTYELSWSNNVCVLTFVVEKHQEKSRKLWDMWTKRPHRKQRASLSNLLPGLHQRYRYRWTHEEHRSSQKLWSCVPRGVHSPMGKGGPHRANMSSLHQTNYFIDRAVLLLVLRSLCLYRYHTLSSWYM